MGGEEATTVGAVDEQGADERVLEVVPFTMSTIQEEGEEETVHRNRIRKPKRSPPTRVSRLVTFRPTFPDLPVW